MLQHAKIYHRNAVAHCEGFILVVRNKDRSDAHAAQELLELDLHFLSELAIQRSERLVEQNELGFRDERAR